MSDFEPGETEDINALVSAAGKKCASELKYTSLTSKEVNHLIDEFHSEVGPFPTFKQVKEFSEKNNGVNCILYTEAALDLIRKHGITADQVILLDPTASKGAPNNHSVIYAADRVYLEPQTGTLFNANDWEEFSSKYAKLINTAPEKIVGYTPRNGRFHVGNNWKVQKN